MARGTQERFAQYAPLVKSSSAMLEAFLDLEIAETNAHPCGICRRLLGEHSDEQVFECAKKLPRRAP